MTDSAAGGLRRAGEKQDGELRQVLPPSCIRPSCACLPNELALLTNAVKGQLLLDQTVDWAYTALNRLLA